MSLNTLLANRGSIFAPQSSNRIFIGLSIILSILLFHVPLHSKSHPLTDSLEHWKATNNYDLICATAEILNKQYPAMPACARLKFFTDASMAAIDAFKPAKSLRYATYARKAARTCKDSSLLMEAILQEAIAYNLLEKIDSAVALTGVVIQYAQRTRKDELMLSALTNLGMMLNKSGAFSKAKAAFQDAIQLIRKNPNPRRLATGYLNLSLSFLNLKDFETGLVHIDSALFYAKQAHIPPLIAHTYGLKSELYLRKGDRERWINTLDTAIYISKQQGNYVQAAYGIMDKFAYQVDTRQFARALETGKEALSMLESSDQYPVLKNAYEGLYKTYKGLGKYPEALLFLEKYNRLQDSLQSATFKVQVHELDLKYEVTEKDRKLLQQSLSIQKNRFALAILGAAFLFISFMVFFYVWRNKAQKETISRLFYKERELEKEIQRLQVYFPVFPSSSDMEHPEIDLQNQLALHAQLLMHKEKLYLDPEFSRNDLVRLLGTNRNYLSQALKEFEEGGFRTFVNRYRINAAKELMKAIAMGDHTITISDLWQKVGFNSNQSFYRIFKGMTDLTPKEYLDELTLEITKNTPQ